MKTNFSVSVIIPTYNRCGYLKRSIESVLEQTYKNINLIIVDDASTDDTEEYIKSLNNKDVYYIKNHSNMGAAKSRNIGIKSSSSDFVAFLDSDDEWYNTKIEEQMKLILKSGHEQDCICFSKVEAKFHNKCNLYPERDIYKNEDITDYIFGNHQFILTISILLPRLAMLNIMFTENLKLFQDVDFCIRAYRKGLKFLFLNKILSKWHCDSREDRITVQHHHAINRMKWLENIHDTFTRKALFMYIKNYIIPKLNNSKEKSYVLYVLKNMTKQHIISSDNSIELIKLINYKF